MATDPYVLFRRPRASADPARVGLRLYDLLAGLLVLFAGLLVFFAPTDPDVWWHLATGRLVAGAGLPPADMFSYTAAGRPWLVQEWLTEMLMAKVQAWAGYGVLGVVFGALQALSAALVYVLARQRGAGRKLAVGAMLVYVVLAAPCWGVRPQVLTPVFLGGFVWALEAYRRSPAQPFPLLALPLAMALWANLHASFFIGFAAIAAYAVGEMANRAAGRPDAAPVRPLWLALAGCLVGSLATPYGPTLWTYPLGYVLAGTASPLLMYTQEWQAIDFHQPGMVMLAGALTIAALAAQRRPTRTFDASSLLLGMGFTLLAVQAVRLLPLFGVAVLPMLAGGLAAVYPALSDAEEDHTTPPAGVLAWAMTTASAVALVVLMLNAPTAQLGPEPQADGKRPYPVGATGYVDRIHPPIRLLNEFEWGGYLLAHLHRHSVFIDGRADMYRDRVFKDYKDITDLAPGWRERMERYGVDTVLIRADSALADALEHEPGWRRSYRDRLAVVYRKTP